MFTRKLDRPKGSILLLGPRGTGKSTWIKAHFPEAQYYDLLDTREALRLSKDPSAIYSELAHLKAGSWAVIDEVQKVPQLLDEVHRLIEEHRLKFVLSGSSARKLKRSGANLLAGRAIIQQMFPLVSAEVNFDLKIPDVFRFGMMPMTFISDDPIGYLKTYAEVYLQEEIKGEALTRNLGNFARFLEVAARHNGQVTNVLGISRDAQVSRQTVQGYFDVLIDTLIGYWLQPWKLKRATKQIAHPKFYFFDAGIARALSGRLAYPPTADELGFLLETFVLSEVRAYLSYSRLEYPIYFWSSHDRVEVDLFCETGKGHLAIEFKSAAKWEGTFNKGLNRMSSELGASKVRCIGVYLGNRAAKFGNIEVMPLLPFLKELWGGKVIS